METVVVTGAAGGIGQAVCEAFVDRGDTVVAGVRDQDTLEALSEDSGHGPGSVQGVLTDVRDEYDVERLMETAARTGDEIDIVVPCAAVRHGARGETSLHAESYAAFDDTIRTNLRGVFAAVREATPHLGAESRVLVPACPVTESPGGDDGVYGVSKVGVTALASVFADDLQAAVCVVDPGVVATPLSGETGRDPSEAAALFVDAASRSPAAINGERIDQRSQREE